MHLWPRMAQSVDNGWGKLKHAVTETELYTVHCPRIQEALHVAAAQVVDLQDTPQPGRLAQAGTTPRSEYPIQCIPS